MERGGVIGACRTALSLFLRTSSGDTNGILRPKPGVDQSFVNATTASWFLSYLSFLFILIVVVEDGFWIYLEEDHMVANIGIARIRISETDQLLNPDS